MYLDSVENTGSHPLPYLIVVNSDGSRRTRNMDPFGTPAQDPLEGSGVIKGSTLNKGLVPLMDRLG